MKRFDRQSTIKGRSSILSQIQNQWIAIFPYELEFTKAIDYSAVFYFQKGYQLIGDLKNPFGPYQSATKQIFNSVDYMISFRLFSLQNLNYKWTLYKRHDSGQEEFIQDFLIDFKDSLGDQITPQPTPQSISRISSGTEKNITQGSVDKDITVCFKNSGVKLKFMLYMADDLKVIEETVSQFIWKNRALPFSLEPTAEPTVEPVIEPVIELEAEKKEETPQEAASSQIEGQAQPPNESQGESIPLNAVPQQAPAEEIKPSEAQEPSPALEEAKVEPIPAEIQSQAKEQTSNPDLLKMQSNAVDIKQNDQVKKEVEGQKLQVVTEEPQNITPMETPGNNPEQPPPQPEQTQKDEAPPAELAPENQVESVVFSQPSSFASKINFKVIIIFLLLLVIGLLGSIVMSQNRVEEPTVQKKKKKAKRK